jgi:hypothetical protein
MEYVGSCRNAARLLDCRARYLAAVGESDEAARTYLLGLQLARLQDREPTLVVFLVNIACRAIGIYGLNGVLQTSDLSPETHAAIEEELAKHDAMESFVHCLRTERAIGMENFRAMPKLWGMLKLDWSSYLEVMEQQIGLGAKSRFELAGVTPVRTRGVARTIDPALESARESMNRTRATIRCLRILNQIHWKGIKTEPIERDSLNLPQAITIDPYNGKPLTVKHTARGWIVYSVGKDEKNDGGKLKDLSDVGVGPPEVMF